MATSGEKYYMYDEGASSAEWVTTESTTAGAYTNVQSTPRWEPMPVGDFHFAEPKIDNEWTGQKRKKYDN